MAQFGGRTRSDEFYKLREVSRNDWNVYICVLSCSWHCLAAMLWPVSSLKVAVLLLQLTPVTVHLSRAIPRTRKPTESSSFSLLFFLGGLTMTWLYPTEVVLPRKMSSVEMESLKSLRASWQETITQSRRIQKKSTFWGWIQSCLWICSVFQHSSFEKKKKSHPGSTSQDFVN